MASGLPRCGTARKTRRRSFVFVYRHIEQGVWLKRLEVEQTKGDRTHRGQFVFGDPTVE